jgi:hypothetical protein
MKRILFKHTNFIPYFVVGKGIAMFSYLTLGTNRAMFTYLTPGINRVFPKYYSTKKSYSPEMRVIYTNFIRALLNNKFNLDATRFNKNDEIISYLEKFQGDKLFTRNHITVIKQGDFERVPLTVKSKEFIKYVQKEFPDFDGFEFTLIKPITKEEGKSLVNNNLKHESVKTEPTIKVKPVKTEPTIKVKPVKMEPTTIIDTIIDTTPTSTPIVKGTSKETITETITKYVEPVVTETIVKIVEPVAKVVDPVVKVVENVANIPNIIINNANNANAEATTVTSNTQHAGSGLDNLLNLFGLKSIAKILKDIFGFEGDGIIYLLIQLPYLVWFLIAFKDNPDIMKYLTENFGIEEFKVPDTELTPLEYNFEVPYDFEQDYTDEANEADFTEAAARNYANNSDVEYFDYFDYYHSKDDETTPTAKEVVEDLKDMGNSLLDTSSAYTKDKVNSIVKAVAELEPYDKEIHVIDDQFSGAIDVFPVSQEVQSIKITNKSNKTSIGSFFRWLFPMLDFYNLNYHPSYFEKFNLNTKVQPITNKVDYVKMLINELYYTLNLGKFEIPQVKFNLPEFGKVTPSSKAQNHADTLSALEGLNTNTNRRTPNWRNTSLISDNTSFSTYFNKDWNKPRDVLLGRLPSVNSSPTDLLINHRARNVPLSIDTNSVDNSWFYDSPLPSVNSTPIRPLYHSDYYPEETTNALATKLDTKIGIHDLLNIKSAINEVDTKMVKLKDQFIEFHHKINRFDEQIAELEAQKLQLTDKFNKGKLTASDWGQLKDVKKQLPYMLDAKASLEASNNLNNDELKSLEIKKSSLLELKNRYEKLLGNIATTPNV